MFRWEDELCKPTKIKELKNNKIVFASDSYLLALKTDGTVYVPTEIMR